MDWKQTNKQKQKQKRACVFFYNTDFHMVSPVHASCLQGTDGDSNPRRLERERGRETILYYLLLQMNKLLIPGEPGQSLERASDLGQTDCEFQTLSLIHI